MRYLRIFLLMVIATFILPNLTEAEEMVTVRLVNYIGDTHNLIIHLIGDYVTIDSTLSLVEFLHRLMDGTILFEHLVLDDVRLNQIRPMIGGNQFKSYLIDFFEYKEGIYTMKGKGYGHGVGMSQWGANVMGESGKTYEEIIQYYYPGTSIASVTK